MKRFIQFLCVSSLVFSSVCFGLGTMNSEPMSQEVLKDQKARHRILHKIIHMVEWPDEVMNQKEFHHCILGKGVSQNHDKLQMLSLQDKEAKIFELDKISGSEHCQTLFVEVSEFVNVKEVLQYALGKPMLLISDIPEFARMGGI